MPRTGGRKRGWCFTYWPGSRPDNTEDEIITLVGGLPTREYTVMQKETGKQGNQEQEGDHIQGWIYFKNTATFEQVKNRLPGMPHIEQQEGSNKQAADYCKKDDTRREPFKDFGIEPQDDGVRTGLTLLNAIKHAEEHGIGATMDNDDFKVHYARNHSGMQKLANRAASKRIPMMRPMMIYYIWGDSDAGKSHWASSRFKPEDTFVVSDTKNTWFDNYQGENCIVLDEFGGHTEWELVKRLLDGSKMNIPTKGSHVYGEYTTVFITSNYHPNSLYDQSKNFFSVPPQAPGPFQRRISTGGLYKVTGHWARNPTWTPAEPVCGDINFQQDQLAPEQLEQQEPDTPPMPDIQPRQQQQQQQEPPPDVEDLEYLLNPFLNQDLPVMPGDLPEFIPEPFGFGPDAWSDNQDWLNQGQEDLSEYI